MVKLNKIYTRTGDDGTTGLVDGSRISKHDPRMAAIGEVDELNSIIGMAIALLDNDAQLDDDTQATALRRIQNDLFDLGADLATPMKEDGDDGASDGASDTASDGTCDGALRIVAEQLGRLETEIDQNNARLTPLENFILPGGNPPAATIHLARAQARRAERSLVAATRTININPLALAYINRLSDHLFVFARLVNDRGKQDILWVPGGSR